MEQANQIVSLAVQSVDKLLVLSLCCTTSPFAKGMMNFNKLLEYPLPFVND